MSATRAACCMLCVTMTIVYSRLQLVHQVLDRRRRDRVEGRGRLVHQEHLGLDGEAARDAEPLLLPAGEAVGARLQPVLHLVPERRLPERPLDALVQVALHAEHARAEGDVVVDRLRERVRLLEHHADALAHLDRVDVGAVEVARRGRGSCPSTVALGIRSFMRLKQRRNVLLPHPDGPMNAVT